MATAAIVGLHIENNGGDCSQCLAPDDAGVLGFLMIIGMAKFGDPCSKTVAPKWSDPHQLLNEKL